MFSEEAFDVAFIIETLLCLPEYQRILGKTMTVPKKWIFLVSLFSDFRVDALCNIYEYDDDLSVRDDSPYNYNTYSLEIFNKFCLLSGAKELIHQDFNIDIDLPEPQNA